MHLDVAELRRFYYRTHLGQIAQRSIRQSLAAHWRDVKGMNLVGYGFAAPFLRPYKGVALRAVSLMPGEQGAFHWPVEGDNISVLADERRWPLATGFVDRLIVAHALENSERPAAVLEEMARVMAQGARAIIVAPNRTGVWARSDLTPFGHGRPFSVGQLERLLRGYALEPVAHSAALYSPPTTRRFWLRSAGMVERMGRRLDAQRLAGAVLVEVEKTTYAAPRGNAPVTARTPLEVLGGLAAPRPKPVAGRSGPDGLAPRRGKG